MTEQEKLAIDAMDYESLLRLWRHAPAGHPFFSGDTGTYYAIRMKSLQADCADPVGASKRVGWDVP